MLNAVDEPYGRAVDLLILRYWGCFRAWCWRCACCCKNGKIP